jgi:hypothetical protein
MLDKEKTEYLRQKLSNMKDSAISETDSVPTQTEGTKPRQGLFNFFATVFKYLAFYGAQYIIISKFVNPTLVLNFFESGVIFLCLTTLIPNRK